MLTCVHDLPYPFCILRILEFAERNVLQDDSGDIRLIDFDQTEIHDCCGDFHTHPGKRLPNCEDVCCEWLREICSSYLHLWDET